MATTLKSIVPAGVVGIRIGDSNAIDGCREAVNRFDRCKTQADVYAVLQWAQQRGGFKQRSNEESQQVLGAYKQAADRVKGK